jgi:hypothetical protein
MFALLNLKGKEELKMSTPEIILAVVTLVVGSGGIGSAITIIINRRKIVSDSRSTDIHTDIDQFKAITEKLKVMADDADARAERARQVNDELISKINDLNVKLSQLTMWVIGDNMQYRSALETALKQVNPDFSFPYVSDPPIELMRECKSHIDSHNKKTAEESSDDNKDNNENA